MMRRTAICGLLLLGACAEGATVYVPYGQVLAERWIGKSQDEVVMTLGPPTEQFPMTTGGRVLQYTKTEVSSETTRCFIGCEYATSNKTSSCVVRFVVDGTASVRSVAAEGNNCPSGVRRPAAPGAGARPGYI
jgi:hypothetical protein